MKLVVDTHTHTISSGHAYCTIMENAKAASENGLKFFCTTDHAPTMPGSSHYWHFGNQDVIPRFLYGVGVFRGIEVNTLNDNGDIDLPEHVDGVLDWMIASFHEPVFAPQDREVHTRALLNVIESGRVDALGHLGNPNFDFDFDKVMRAAAVNHVAIELNNSSLNGRSRKGSIERCLEIAKCAVKHQTFITTGTDAHFCTAIGIFDDVRKTLEQAHVPEELVITHSKAQFLEFLALRERKPIPEFTL